MIFDECVNWRRYVTGNRSAWCQAFELIRSFTADSPDGREVVLPNQLYANIFSYDGEGPEKCRIEAHGRFIDIQTLLVGAEEMVYQPTEGLKSLAAYDAETDCAFFEPQRSEWCVTALRPGNFVIYYPGEGHTAFQPPERIGRRVKKIVVKLALELVNRPEE